jgi:beta-barrel assembly-enhancing protease
MVRFLFPLVSRSFFITILCTLIFLAKESPAQVTSIASAPIGPLAAENGGLDFSAWLPRSLHNSLQADPETLLAFTQPWLVSSRVFELASAAVVPRTTRSLPKPKTYRLEPDPFDWSLKSSSPDDDDFAYLPDVPHPGRLDAAQRMAELSQAHRPSHVAAKYDVALIGEREIGQGLNFFSIEKEVALGRELATEVEQSARLVTDPAITEYVNRTGQMLVQHSDCKVPFIIKVIDDDEVNAFALPGGFFYVNTGVILAADDEAEFAGVMAHEIAHVCARHATRNLTKSEIAQYASLPLIFFGGPVGYAIRQVSSIAMPLSFLKFSRDAEREADMLGIEYQYAAGYDPTAFVDFFEKLESEGKESHNFVARAFMTHPMTDDRVRRAEATLEILPDRENYITDTSQFDEIRDRVSRLMHGHGLKGGARPHPTLRRRNGTQ